MQLIALHINVNLSFSPLPILNFFISGNVMKLGKNKSV